MSTSEVVNDILAHHGVKGMRWGVRRKATVNAQEIVVSDRRKRLKTSGGRGLPAHSDAVRARTVGQKARGSGLKALSNDELGELQRRLNLEQSVKRLQYQDSSPPKKFVLTLLGRAGNQAATDVSNASSKKVGAMIAKKMAKG